MEGCPFCLPAIEPQIILSDAHCYAIWTQETPEGSAMVLPRAHRPTVFDLTDAEWVSTRRLLEELRSLITTRQDPDGWNVGWNVDPVGGQSIPHAHCHLLPRYSDEPHAGRGIRAWLKDPANRPPRHGSARPPSWRSFPCPDCIISAGEVKTSLTCPTDPSSADRETIRLCRTRS